MYKMINDKSFSITSVSRFDLANDGYNVTNVTDEQMEKLASSMADAYLDGQYWQDLQIIADYMEIPRKEKSNDK